MQEQMAQAQEELANGDGRGLRRRRDGDRDANAAGEIQQIEIDPKAIDPDDPEMLDDLVLAGVNEALRTAQALTQSRLGGAARRLGPAGSEAPAC